MISHNYKFFLLFLVVFLVSCGNINKIDPDKLIGTWNIGRELTHKEIERFLGDVVPPSENISVNFSGNHTFYANQTYEYNITIEMTFFMGANNIEIALITKGTGTWELQKDLLTETIQSSEIMPANAFTEQLARENPSFMQDMDHQGEISTSKILSVSESILELYDEEFDITILLYK